jgi:capsid assembly protease
MTESLLGRIVGTPWAIQAPALQTIAEIAAREVPDPAALEQWKGFLAPHRQQQTVAFRPAAELPGARRAALRDGVAVVPVTGPIFRRANLLTQLSGATSLDDIAMDLGAAREDPRVKAILLEVDSPGGHADGIAEVARAIRASAGTKPVVAYVDGLAGSAAYWLAAAASRVVVAPTAVVGSLGAVAIFPPDKAGARPMEIVSSQTPGKRASPYTDAGRAQLQALIDRLADVFLADLAGFRGLSVQDLLDATQGGGMLMGADAVQAGLADRVDTFEATLAGLASGDPGPAWTRPRRAEAVAHPLTEEIGMADEQIGPEAASAAAGPAPQPEPQPAPPALAELAPGATPADARAEERARCAAVMAAARPGFETMAQLAVAEGWSAETFARAQAAAEPAVKAAAAAAFRDSLPAPVAAAEPAPQSAEDRARASWEADADLRAEFGGQFASYVAFTKAEAAGRVKRIGQRAA